MAKATKKTKTPKAAASAKAEAQAKPDRKKVGHIGYDGSSVWGGVYSQEYLSDLRCPAAYDVFDEMRRSDAQIKMALKATKAPLLGAAYKHEPVDDSDEAKKVAEFCDWMWLRNPFWRFPRWLSEVLSFIDFGFSLHEYGFATYQHPEFGLVHMLGSMAFRNQKTVNRWLVTAEGFQGIEQMVMGDTVDGKSAIVTIPASRLCLFTNDIEGDTFEGVSMLRSAYGAWFRKQHLLKMNMIGAEKAAIGTPIGEYPLGAASDGEKDKFKAILSDFTAHESSFLMHPVGYKIEFAKNQFDSEKLMAAITYEDGQIAKALLLAFMELGQNGNGGSFSLGTDLSDLFLNGLQFVGEMIAERMFAINQVLVEMNFGRRELTPETRVSGINDKATKDLAEIVKTLADGKIIRPDDQLESHLRAQYNLPEAQTTREEDAANGDDPAGEPGGDPNEDPEGQGDEEQEQDDEKPVPERDDQGKPGRRPRFSERDGFQSFRGLTLAEQGLDLGQSLAEFEGATSAVTNVMRTELAGMVSYLVRETGKRIAKASSRLKVVDKIPLETKEYEKRLLRVMAENVAVGYRQADRDLAAKTKGARKFADKKTTSNLEFLPEHVQEVLKKQAKSQAENQAAELKKTLDFTVQGADVNGLSNEQLEYELGQKLGDYVNGPKIDNGARTIASQSVNYGRQGFFFDEANLRQVQGFQYSAILDGATTDICLSLDGKTFAKSDPDAERFRPPNHFGCRSILVPITLTEETPRWTGLQEDPSNPSLVAEYERRGVPVPDLAKIKKSRNLSERWECCE